MSRNSMGDEMKEAADLASTEDELHHSLLLIVVEDDRETVACMSNHQVTKGHESLDTAKEQHLYHCDRTVATSRQKLRDSGVGSSLSGQGEGIYKCEQEQALEAISYGIATPSDFLVISGVCVWPKLGVGGSPLQMK
ncbi:hypothetical protein ACHAXM_006948 [Skeletonema potamos]